jgi:hypothetical protein
MSVNAWRHTKYCRLIPLIPKFGTGRRCLYKICAYHPLKAYVVYVKHLRNDGQDENTFLFNSPRYPKATCLVWKFSAFAACPSDNSGSTIKTSRENLRNNNGRVKPKYTDRNLPGTTVLTTNTTLLTYIQNFSSYTTENKPRDNNKD